MQSQSGRMGVPEVGPYSWRHPAQHRQQLRLVAGAARDSAAADDADKQVRPSEQDVNCMNRSIFDVQVRSSSSVPRTCSRWLRRQKDDGCSWHAEWKGDRVTVDEGPRSARRCMTTAAPVGMDGRRGGGETNAFATDRPMNDGLHREVIAVTRNNDRLLSDGRTSGVVYYEHNRPRQMTDVSRRGLKQSLHTVKRFSIGAIRRPLTQLTQRKIP